MEDFKTILTKKKQGQFAEVVTLSEIEFERPHTNSSGLRDGAVRESV